MPTRDAGDKVSEKGESMMVMSVILHITQVALFWVVMITVVVVVSSVSTVPSSRSLIIKLFTV